MAMYWLDLVRYADTLGYHGDQDRSVSPYRDYVIQAFNNNKPFDQFTIEQLAGDLLPGASLSQRVASTYNRLNRASGEGGGQPKEYLAKYSADRVRTMGSVWLGSTVGCAECHDHKFDPFTTKDFYSFAAFFADIKEQGIVGGAKHVAILPVPTPEQAEEQGRLKAQLEIAQAEYLRDDAETRSARSQWVGQIAEAARQWTTLQPTSVSAANGAKLTVADDGVVTASGQNADNDIYNVSCDNVNIAFNGQKKTSIALRFEVLTHDGLPQNGPGRAGNGNFVINAIDLKVNGDSVEWKSAKSTHDQSGFPASNLASKSTKGWAILPKAGQSHEVILIGELKSSTSPADDGPKQAEITVVHSHGTGHNVGRFRVSLSSSTDVDLGVISDPAMLAVIELPESDHTPEQAKTLDDAFRKYAPTFANVRGRIATIETQQKTLAASIVTTLGTTAAPPREIRVLPRGDWMSNSGEIVQPTVPVFLSGETARSDARSTRLDLANWLTSDQNPLVARAFVNRLWMLYFGHGLARNVDDLGSQGDVPTHPELLDWLAAEFIESDWDIKHMTRLMLRSNAYQRSSRETDELRQKDPLNRLLARQSRYRLEAEMVRDNALRVSGLLDSRIGGRSVRPYQPAGYWAQLNFPKRKYQHDGGPSQYRRGLYTHWQRTFLHPSLMAFDAPAREECTAQRSRSNTPLQSLVLLNDPTFVEAARVLAQRVLRESEGTLDDRLDFLYHQVLARRVRHSEQPLLARLYEENRLAFASDKASVDELLEVGLAPVPADCDRVDLAAWTAVARAVLNLHETITRY